MEARIASGHSATGTGAAANAGSDDKGVADVGTAAALRPQLRAARTAMSEDQRAQANDRIADYLDDWAVQGLTRPMRKGSAQRVLAAFWPLGPEPDLRDWLMRQSADPELMLALPVVVERDAPLVFKRWWPGAPMRDGAYGIAEPDHDQIVTPDVMLLPALGFTAQADRIGYGGGYYDRTLAGFDVAGRKVQTIAVAYACGLLAEGTHVPAPHDRRVDAVLSETGWTPKMPV
ncbi:5-formyltetrahydrofolate cyclo-ligase [Pigmentiphaga aceris]|nr:5-formyltetrahydrofolate cyclo-ligase [Pigmentiphaga aceris]